MVARQADEGVFVAAIGAHVAVAVEQFAIVQGRHDGTAARRQRLALDGDDAVHRDERAFARIAAHAAMDGEAVIAGHPGDEILGVVKTGMLPVHPTVRCTRHVERQDEWMTHV